MHVNDNKIRDYDSVLDREFGKPGTEKYNKSLSEAWEEYNADILLNARKSSGLTQAQLAQRIGADKSYISRIERGLTVPTVATLYRLAAAMGMSITLKPAL